MLQEIKIQSGQSIYDVSINELNGLDNLLQLLIQNKNITNLDFDLKNIATENIKYDDIYIEKKQAELTLTTSISSTIQNIKTLQGQSIYDICLQSYGSLDLMNKLLKDNNIYNLDSTDISMRNINFDETKVIDKYILDYIYKNKINYSTGINLNMKVLVTESGIIINTESGQTIIIE